MSRHRVSRAAIELIKRFEGCRRHAAQLPDGRWTIGYGHTLTAREDAEVTEPDAEALLLYDLISVAHLVNENVYAPISQNQFDALCSFAFNIGSDNFRRSQVLKRLNAGAAVQAACAMELWRKADFEGERIVIDALVRRRAAEKALFLTPAGDAWVPAPSPVLRPVVDLEAADLVPATTPVEVETTVEGDRIVVRRETPAEEAGAPALAAAAEAVAGRLETLFADPGEEPAPPAADEADGHEVRPQADFAPPITTALETPEPAADQAPLQEPEAAPAEAELAIPAAPAAPHEAPAVQERPFEFIPLRNRPAPAPAAKEPSVVWDLLLALFGLAFFGFGVFWGLNAQAAPSGWVTPVMVAWPAGLAGVGFVVVAVFRLLERLGREAERD
jgi:lysozyme